MVGHRPVQIQGTLPHQLKGYGSEIRLPDAPLKHASIRRHHHMARRIGPARGQPERSPVGEGDAQRDPGHGIRKHQGIELRLQPVYEG